MKKSTKAGEFFNSRDYRIHSGFDVIRHENLVVLLMDNNPYVVTETQWEKACAKRVTWNDEDVSDPDEDLNAIWYKLLEHDIASRPRGKKAITAVTAE